MTRILHIIPRLCKGGVERLCLDICNQLRQCPNVQVQLITFSNENEYPFLTSNIDWQVVPAKVQLSVFGKNRCEVSTLQKAIEDFNPNVIHTHLFEAEVVTRSCNYPQAKWFSHCHDNMRQFLNFGIKTLLNKQLFTNWFEKQYLTKRYKANGGNTFVAISKDTESYFRRCASSFKTILLPNAIDYSRFYKPRTFGNNTKLTLVNVGSYQAKKNQQFLVEVAMALRTRKVDFELHLLGDGVLYKQVEQQIKANHLEPCIMQHGNVNNVEEYLGAADVYTHSAYYEPLGLVILEAMAAGLPVVTLDGKGNRDLIDEGKNGFMLYDQNPELFADKILEIWNGKQKYQEMSRYAQKFARRYDIKPYVDKLLGIYKI